MSCRGTRHQKSLQSNHIVRPCVTAEAAPQAEAEAGAETGSQQTPQQNVSSFLRGLLAPAIRPACDSDVVLTCLRMMHKHFCILTWYFIMPCLVGMVSNAHLLCRDPLLQAAEGIRQSIASGNQAVIPGLVDTLLSASRPFDERQIGGGPWQVHCAVAA